MNPLILHLKYRYYNMIIKGQKKHEYREAKPFWLNRITTQTEVVFVPGYNLSNNLNINAIIKDISIIDKNKLPDYAKKEFYGSKYNEFIDIEFEIKKRGSK